MKIDVEDELGYLEGIKDNLQAAKQKYLEQAEYLEVFERKIRKMGYPMIIKQTNTAKMEIEFEHCVAQNETNWTKWMGLKDNLVKAEIVLEKAKVDWQYALERHAMLLAVLKSEG